MTRLADLLDRRMEEIQAPPALPQGTYLAVVKRQPEQDELTSNKDGTLYDVLRFQLEVISAEEVEPELLDSFGKVAGVTLRQDFMFTTAPDEDVKRKSTLNRLKRFLLDLGASEDDDTALNEALAASVGCQIMVEVSHRANPNDPDQVFAQIERTWAV